MGFKGRDAMMPFRAYQGNVLYLCNSNEGRDMPDSAFLLRPWLSSMQEAGGGAMPRLPAVP